ncbi:MAG: DUF6285 domain-containing protein [Tepidiformaceae bacterium]
MQDHPTMEELLGAIAGFLRDDVMPNTSGRVQFHARVSANVLDILQRQLRHEEAHIATEWAGLDGLLGPQAMPPSPTALREALHRRNEDLARRVREGFGDEEPLRAALIAHLRTVVDNKLVIDTPALARHQVTK